MSYKSGNVIHFKNDNRIGFVVQRQFHPMLYQATKPHGIHRVPLKAALTNVPFTVFWKNIFWSEEAEIFADSLIGQKYGMFGFGYTNVTYVAAVLNKAGAEIPLRGLTVSELIRQIDY